MCVAIRRACARITVLLDAIGTYAGVVWNPPGRLYRTVGDTGPMLVSTLAKIELLEACMLPRRHEVLLVGLRQR
jgi:hypothetical protein